MLRESAIDKDADEHWMREALQLAQQAAKFGEVPVGAIVVRDGVIIGRGFNQPIMSCDPTAHAEIVAIRDASLHCNNYRLPETSLYVTIEPCTMCFGAMLHARIGRLIFGATEPKAGAIVSQAAPIDASHFNHQLSVSQGVLMEECSKEIQNFFKSRRKGN